MEFTGFSNAYELAIEEHATNNSETIDIDIPTPKNLPKLPPNRLLQHAIQPRKPVPKNQPTSPVSDNQVSDLVELISSHILSQDRVMIVSSGTKSKSKAFRPEMNISTYESFSHFQPLPDLFASAIPACDLYTGKTHRQLVSAISQLQQKYDIEHRLISPLYGLISPSKRIIPYDCSYLDKSFYIQTKMAVDKNIPFQLQQLILDSSVDVVILALSKSYQVIIDLLSKQAIKHKMVYLLKYSSQGIELQHIMI